MKKLLIVLLVLVVCLIAAASALADGYSDGTQTVASGTTLKCRAHWSSRTENWLGARVINVEARFTTGGNSNVSMRFINYDGGTTTWAGPFYVDGTWRNVWIPQNQTIYRGLLQVKWGSNGTLSIVPYPDQDFWLPFPL